MTGASPQAGSRAAAVAWWMGIRPRTLTLAIVPVVVGSTLAWSQGAAVHSAAFVAALVCAALIQIGTNLLNDAGDAARGADGPDRIGPLRITASGLASAADVRRLAAASFAAALLAGVYLIYIGGAVIFAIGLASIAAGYAYSSGRRPVSHSAWGEAYVLVFFGIVAVVGSYYLQRGFVAGPVAPVVGLALGSHAAAVLLVNNVRDAAADALAGRATLALRIGSARSRQLYAALMLLPFPLLSLVFGATELGVAWLSLPACLWLVWRFRGMPIGAEMNAQLAYTALAQVLLGTLLCVAVVQ